MPGERLSLAVRVGCQEDFRSALGGGFQILDRRFLSRNRHVFRLEGMLDIYPERALRQVAHMTHRRANVVLGTKKTAKRSGSCGPESARVRARVCACTRACARARARARSANSSSTSSTVCTSFAPSLMS